MGIKKRLDFIYEYLVNKANLPSTCEELVFAWNSQNKGDPYYLNDISHDKCVALRHDIDLLNLDYEREHIIINNGDYTYQIATDPKQIKDMLEQLYFKPAKMKFYKAGVIARKVKRDGNMQLLDNETLLPNMKEFIDVFVEEIDDETI